MFHTIKKISPLAGKSFLSYGDWCLIFTGCFSIVIDGFLCDIDLRDLNSICPHSIGNDMGPPKRPDIVPQNCVLAGNVRDSY